MRGFIYSLLLGLLLTLLGGCSQPGEETLHLSGQTMGTGWSVSFLPTPEASSPVAIKRLIQQRLDLLNRLLSSYDPDSEISRFNTQHSRNWFAISPETAQVIELSQQISRFTAGAFDISVGPLVDLWGFGAAPRSEQLPSAEQVQQQLAQVGYQNLELRLDPPAIRKLVPQLRIDLSAVAKGYAVDSLQALLEAQGIRSYVLEIGGELQLSGRRHDGSPWRIAIEKPQDGLSEVAGVFRLTATALATSGIYRNYYVVDGQRYVHTIDPVSGRPVQHKLASVTLLDPSCARADALATALMVMGEERARQFVEKHRLAAFFLVHSGDSLVEYTSLAFQSFLNQVKP